MTSRFNDTQVLVVPRKEGLLVVIDGASYWKAMRPIQLVWLAQALLTTASEAMEKDDGLARQEQKEAKEVKQNENN